MIRQFKHRIPLKAVMCFAGPRPEEPSFVDNLEGEVPFHSERHMVKPGITGRAQINYSRGASIEGSASKPAYELYCAKNYPQIPDFAILLQTLRAILWPGAAR